MSRGGSLNQYPGSKPAHAMPIYIATGIGSSEAHHSPMSQPPSAAITDMALAAAMIHFRCRGLASGRSTTGRKLPGSRSISGRAAMPRKMRLAGLNGKGAA